MSEVTVSADFQAARLSQKGDRAINQDRCEIFQHQGIVVLLLADGMGGHPKGEVAAQIFIDAAYHSLKNIDASQFGANDFIHEVLATAHRNIVSFGRQKRPYIYPRTTAVMVIIDHGMMHWAHMGDSRIYLFRDGRAVRRSLDHTQAEYLRLSGEIEDTDSQSETSGRSGVSRCLGGKKQLREVEISKPMAIMPGDTLLLCSDGIWSQLKEARIEKILSDGSQSLQQRTADLVDAAVRAGHPASDNATALTLFWQAKSGPIQKAAKEALAGDEDVALQHLRNLISQYPKKTKEP